MNSLVSQNVFALYLNFKLYMFPLFSSSQTLAAAVVAMAAAASAYPYPYAFPDDGPYGLPPHPAPHGPPILHAAPSYHKPTYKEELGRVKIQVRKNIFLERSNSLLN
jgi:hypothetical protein